MQARPRKPRRFDKRSAAPLHRSLSGRKGSSQPRACSSLLPQDVGEFSWTRLGTRMAWSASERPCQGHEFWEADIAVGSRAGVRGRGSTGSSTTHTGSSRPYDRNVLFSGRPHRSGGRCLTAIMKRSQLWKVRPPGRHATFVRATKRLAGSIHKFGAVLGGKWCANSADHLRRQIRRRLCFPRRACTPVTRTFTIELLRPCSSPHHKVWKL